MATTLVAEGLREQVELQQGPADGTVVKFKYIFDLDAPKEERRKYTYAAVYVAKKNRWFLSGIGSALSREYQHADFMRMLAQPNVAKASVATGFAKFKP